MVKVLILGSTGMLGSAVGKHFLNLKDKYDTHTTYRNKDVSYGEKKHFFDVNKVKNFSSLPKVDYIINCIGTIKPFMDKDPIQSIYVNSIFPWELSRHCKENNIKLIHITTDCVFSGKKGNYTEKDDHDALDNYGKSKSLGEPDNCMVLRTSIIGEEIHKNASLISWVKDQAGKEINGFTNHYWNGITTIQYAKICENIIDKNLYETGLYHIHSPHSVSKYELVSMLNDKFKLDIKIKKFEAPISIDRTIKSDMNITSFLNIPTIEQQIVEM